MNDSEFLNLKNKQNTPDEIVTINDLANKEDRTLLYGYTCNRRTFHVYIKDAEIHII